MQVLGLDIGGANIKAATADGASICLPFAIWRDPSRLAETLRTLPLVMSGPPEIVALTMTAELADCFATKAEGVEFVVRTVQQVFSASLVRVWLTSGEFAGPEDAVEFPQLVAAANWHALATWAGRAVPQGAALLIDVGSTTTDVIPLLDGIPVSEGTTDLQRLASSELLYTGIRRTPLCAVVQSVPLPSDSHSDLGDDSSASVPLAAELFATMLDVYLLNGDLAENADDHDTADGRPATRSAALNRLAHMLCCDATELSESQLLSVAQFIADAQLRQIADAIENRAAFVRGLAGSAIDTGPVRLLLCGSGVWLAERAIQETGDSRFMPVINLSTMFVRNVSTCAPAFAVARLAAERCLDDLLPLSSF